MRLSAETQLTLLVVVGPVVGVFLLVLSWWYL